MKKSRTRVIRVLIFCTLLAANWLVLLPGSTTVFAKPAGRPDGLPHSQVIDPPIFTQDQDPENGCNVLSKDFDTTAQTDPSFMNGKAHYHVLTINDGGSKCDHLSWNIHKTVPQAAMNTCRFFMQFAGIDSPNGLRFKLRDKWNNLIKESEDPSVPGNGVIDVKGVHVVEADLNGIEAGTTIDVGTLFVDCDSNDLKNPIL